jgi:acyl carrier protein
MEQKFIEQFKDILESEDRELNLTDEFRQFDEWDSLANLSVVAMIDEEYNVVIPTADFNKIKTIGELLEEIKRRMA